MATGDKLQAKYRSKIKINTDFSKQWQYDRKLIIECWYKFQEGNMRRLLKYGRYPILQNWLNVIDFKYIGVKNSNISISILKIKRLKSFYP